MHTLVRATLLNKWNAYYVLKDIVSKSCYEKINQTVYAWNTMPTNRRIIWSQENQCE